MSVTSWPLGLFIIVLGMALCHDAQAIEQCKDRSGTPCAVSTFHSVSVYWSPDQGGGGKKVRLAYRPKGTTAWEEGLALVYNPAKIFSSIREQVKGDYRGSLVGLSPGTLYEVRMELEGTSLEKVLEVSTWSEVFPSKDNTTKLTQSGLTSYELTTSGTAQNYHIVDGKRPDGSKTVIDAKKRERFNVRIDASFVVLRNFVLKGSSSDAILIEDGAHHVVIEQNEITDWGSPSDAIWKENGQTKRYVSKWVGKNHEAAVRAKGQNQRVKVSHLIIQNNVIHDPTYGSNHWGQCSLYVVRDKQNTLPPDCDCQNTKNSKAAANYPKNTEAHLRQAEERCTGPSGGNTNHPGGPQAFDMTQSDGNHVVRYNTVYSTSEKRYFNDIFGGSSTNNSAIGYPGADSDFYGNFIANCWDNGFEMEGGGQNVRVWGNVVDKCYEPMANAPVLIGPLYLFRNISKASFRTPIGFDAKISKSAYPGRFLKGGGPRRSAPDYQREVDKLQGYTYVFHNTLDNTNNEGASGIGNGRTLRHVDARNNIFWVRDGSQAVTENDNEIGDVEFRHNTTNGAVYPAAKKPDHFNHISSSYLPDFAHKTLSVTPDASYPATAWQAPILVHYDLKPGQIGHDGKDVIGSPDPQGRPGNFIPNFSLGYLGKAPDVGAQEAGSAPMIVGPRDATMTTPPPSCVPTGQEVCGNGIDDDCDGQKDEGCAPTPSSLRAEIGFRAAPGLDGSVEDLGAALFGLTPQSAQAQVHVAWNQDALHVGVVVDDDDLQASVGAGEEGKVWQDDAVELFLDPTKDGGAGLSGQDLQLIVNLNGATYTNRQASTEHRVTRLSGRFVIEMVIPWSTLGLTPLPGLEVGVNVALNDRDASMPKVQSQDWRGAREGFGEPSEWGVWVLKEQGSTGDGSADLGAGSGEDGDMGNLPPEGSPLPGDKGGDAGEGSPAHMNRSEQGSSSTDQGCSVSSGSPPLRLWALLLFLVGWCSLRAAWGARAGRRVPL